jgi:hypothetical protein
MLWRRHTIFLFWFWYCVDINTNPREGGYCFDFDIVFTSVLIQGGLDIVLILILCWHMILCPNYVIFPSINSLNHNIKNMCFLLRGHKFKSRGG